MDLKNLKDRLAILIASDVVTSKSEKICLDAFSQLQKRLGTEMIEGAEMLFTHLPMSLTRIERGEEVEAPMPGLMAEVKQSQWFNEAMEEIIYIEENHGNPLPPEEVDYLLLHYTTVFSQNQKRRVAE